MKHLYYSTRLGKYYESYKKLHADSKKDIEEKWDELLDNKYLASDFVKALTTRKTPMEIMEAIKAYYPDFYETIYNEYIDTIITAETTWWHFSDKQYSEIDESEIIK